MIIDAKNQITGRLGTHIAKRALLGEQIIVVNSEQAVITGKKENVFADFKRRRNRTTSQGPYIPRRADLLLKRMMRNMLPHKKQRGRDALSRITCFVGEPNRLKDETFQQFEEADIKRLDNMNYTTIREVCRHLGGKI